MLFFDLIDIAYFIAGALLGALIMEVINDER